MDAAGEVLDGDSTSSKLFGIGSGRIEDTRWSLSARPTDEGICVTVEHVTETNRRSSADSNTLCGFSETELSLAQVSFDRLDPVLVFGTVPLDVHRALLDLEDGRTERLELRLGLGEKKLQSYYVAVLKDVTTEGSVVTLGRGGGELDRRALCAPESTQMLDRGTVNVPLFCGAGVD